jgi:lysophospholipase L1-like esterase
LVKLIEDVGKVIPDKTYNPLSENAQSGVAVAEAITMAKGDILKLSETAIQSVIDLRNLYDGVTWGEYGYTINGRTGDIIEGTAGDRVSDFIPVEPNTVYTGNKIAVGCFYDINKNYVAGFWNATFTTPATAAYIRLSIGVKIPSAAIKEAYLLKGSYSSRPEDIGCIKIKNVQIDTENLKNRCVTGDKVEFSTITAESLAFVKSNRNHMEGISYEMGKTLDRYGSISENENNCVTDYIALKSGTAYTINGYVFGGVVGYTDEKIPIGNITTSDTFGGTFTTQEDCKYIRLCTQTSVIDKVTLFELAADQTQPNTFTMEGLKVGIDNLGSDVLSSVKAPLSSILADLIFTTKTKKIKLIGDSITHGMCSSDFAPSTAAEDFLFNAGSFPQYRNYGVKCWGGMLKTYLESKFDCTVTNNGASGASAQQLVDNWDAIVSADDDVIICMIGTNDRQKTLSTIYQSIVDLYEKAQANNQRIIFMSAPPASVENEMIEDENGKHIFIIHMEDIDNLYNYVNNTLNVGYISIYKAFLNYCRDTGISVDALLADGLHPNDEGYKLMFEIVLENLGFGRKREITDNSIIDEISALVGGV